MGFGHFFKNVCKAAGHVAGAGIHVVAKGTGAIGGAIGHVPIVGKGFKAAYSFSVGAPFKMADNVAKGQRLDHVVLNHLKDQVADVKTVAPYAQMVVSLVPGVGTGISGALGAGLALASGQNITDALKAGIRGAIPGGPIGKAAFDMGTAAVSGGNILSASLSITGLTDEQRKALVTGLSAARAIAQGKNVSHTIVENALKVLPADARKAVTVGMAVATGQNLQKIAIANLPIPAIVAEGKKAVLSNPIYKAGAQVLKDPKQLIGYTAALGMMTSKVLPVELMAARAKLDAQGKLGFDIGLSAHVGVVTRPIPSGLNPAQAFGYVAAHGMSGAKPGNKAVIMKTLVKDANIKTGASVAVTQALKERKKTWWERIKAWLKINPGSTVAQAKVAIKVPSKTIIGIHAW